MRCGRLLGLTALAVVTACSSSSGGGGDPSTFAASTRTTATTTTTTTSATGVPGSATTPASAVAGLPKFAHILVVVMENHGYNEIVGSSSAPYINSLIRTGTLLTQSYALTHPSEPNYLALFSGSTHGLSSDACPLSYRGPDLYSALRAVGRQVTGYSEGLPSVGSTVCFAGKYARKHAPWTDFTDVPGSVGQPLTAFPSDYTKLPSVGFVIPNLDDDMHDGTVAQGDAWLKLHLAGYVSWARTHDSLLVLTYDEDDRGENNRIPTVFAGAHTKAGYQYGGRVDHYRVLRTIEDVFGTQHLGTSALRTPITTIWT